MSDMQIQLLGRWSSQAFKKYYTPSRNPYYETSYQFHTIRPLPFPVSASAIRTGEAPEKYKKRSIETSQVLSPDPPQTSQQAQRQQF
jgi:hypothetical protein